MVNIFVIFVLFAAAENKEVIVAEDKNEVTVEEDNNDFIFQTGEN